MQVTVATRHQGVGERRYDRQSQLALFRIIAMDASFSGLQRSIFQSKVRRARETSPSQKIAEAAALFDETIALMGDAIATDNPGFAPEQIHAEVLRRLRIARRLDEAGIYTPAGSIHDQP